MSLILFVCLFVLYTEELTIEFSQPSFTFLENSGLNLGAICLDVATNVVLSPSLQITVSSGSVQPVEAEGEKVILIAMRT